MEKLQFIGSNTLGALEFYPDLEKEIINIKKLYEESKKIYFLKTNINKNKFQNIKANLKTLIALSNSTGGGARAKVIVGFNPHNKTISITKKQEKFPNNYYPVIIKYDNEDISNFNFLNEKYKKASINTTNINK